MQEKERTLGDGMDDSLLNRFRLVGQDLRPFPIETKISSDRMKSLIPVEPKSKVYYLIPKYVPKLRKLPKYLVKKHKEPKFVPYEPYKAAVEPILFKKMTNTRSGNKNSKNDIEILELVRQMSDLRKSEMSRIDTVEDENTQSHKLILQWAKEKEGLLIDIKNLRETNSHLENQVKFQAQVNSELKTLLVAAVGEDLESRVQHLTEDKLSLARALLNSADNLTSHQEQTEWLSGQCEVWRSKFLASSLMVEELAKWKSALTNRVNDIQNVTKTLLGERRKMHNQVQKTFNSLKCVAESLSENEKQPKLIYGNILDVTNVNYELSEYIKSKLKLGENRSENEIINSTDLVQQTVAERTAYKLLQNPVSITTKQDVLCDAVVGAASHLRGIRMFPQTLSVSHCCPHCKGDIQDI
ncbi:hypothetical protein JTB14_029599 [Gonioctena quinquepunctata]|nr:hypothetical protein JTB14_029599 [Gonioctena quinquepunctata]